MSLILRGYNCTVNMRPILQVQKKLNTPTTLVLKLLHQVASLFIFCSFSFVVDAEMHGTTH